MKPTATLGNSYVYVLGDKGGPQKVGIANDPYRRLLSLQTGNAASLVLSAAVQVPSDQVAAVETHTHWLLREKLARGEWFSCTPKEALEAIYQAVSDVQSGTAESIRRSASVPATLEQNLASIGWSARELAIRLGAHPNTVNDWRLGRRETPEPVLAWLADVAAFHARHPAPEWRRLR